MRGAAMPKSRFSASPSTRPTCTMRSRVNCPGTLRQAACGSSPAPLSARARQASSPVRARRAQASSLVRCGDEFGVAGKAKIGRVQHRFGDGQRHQRRRRAVAHGGDAALDRTRSSRPALTGSGAPGVSSTASGVSRTANASPASAMSRGASLTTRSFGAAHANRAWRRAPAHRHRRPRKMAAPSRAPPTRARPIRGRSQRDRPSKRRAASCSTDA